LKNTEKMKQCKTEKELVNYFLKTFLDKEENTRVFTEVPTSWGIVDILSIRIKKSVFRKRQEEINKRNCKPITTIASYAIPYLKRYGNLTPQELADILKIRNGVLLETIQLLLDRGIVQQYKNGKLHLNPIKNILAISHVTAFEAKLSNWRKAIEQAERHLWFANCSYIVIPEPSSKVQTLITRECMERNIGLTIQTKDGHFSTARYPSMYGYIDSYLLWKINENLIDGRISLGH